MIEIMTTYVSIVYLREVEVPCNEGALNEL